MAITNVFGRHSKTQDDDSHDHIGSGASTPPGAMTPRPDLHDKRLPGIINSYFGQVRDTLFPGSNASSSENTPQPSSTSDKNPPQPEEEKKEEDSERRKKELPHPVAERPITPSSPTSPSAAAEPVYTPPASPEGGASAGPNILSSYPTPPLSNSSSFLVPKSSEGRPAGAGAAETPSRKRSWQNRRSRRSFASLTSALRRHTLSSSVSNIITKPPVSAHISNPATDPSSPTSAAPDATAAPAAPSSQKRSSRLSQHINNNTKAGDKLTTGAAPPHQNTPPQTPRSFSRDSRRDDLDVPNVPKVSKSSRSSSGGSNRATIGQLKGQLEICIEEGRGLRPSVEPYVVCIFQLNEDISGGPKEDEMDTRADNAAGQQEENLAKGVAMKRIGSGSGTPIAIPGLRSRQTSQTNIAQLRRESGAGKPPNQQETTDPVWRHNALFDVVGENNEVDISVYDRSNNESFIGHVRLPLNLEDYEHQHEDWYKLQPREGVSDHVSGEVRLKIAFKASGKKTFGPDDFEILKLIGKGTFGQVFQVRKKDTKRIYAMKVLSKKVIVQKKEIQHTIGERNILVRTATSESPFIVGLKFSFQTAADLYLVTDYMSGGELFWHLQKEGRFMEHRAKFYIAELILALRHLHQHDIVYRDLKPENILLDANGHIALCDFGLSKANLAKNDTTNTFCGTTEYLAPEVLLDEQGYTKMVDFWSLGVLVFEMCCGWSPFYAEDTQQMYKNIAFGKVRFPRDALSQEGRNFVKGLLNRNPAHRLGAKGDAEELMAHPFFADIDWNALSKKISPPPFKPKLKGELDTSNFDPEFTNALNDTAASSLNARAAALASGIQSDSTPLSPTMQNQFKGFTFVDESTLEKQFGGRGHDDEDEDEEDMEGVDADGVNGGRNGGSAAGATGGGSSAGAFSSRGAGDRMSGIEGPNHGGGGTGGGSAGGGGEEFSHGMLEDI